ncbi:DNA polymerase delta subunit 4 isoform X2 [Protopterus annectens]|uniref:DNA polymerase delta subunit 4 isoform X2 n=1 Tax=Protopterus annectens TaxID=7888 RepID=UPI001CFB4AF6|nr:DNA polymerase delta subunit 4 isoform X2 [Protopterus annectens]
MAKTKTKGLITHSFKVVKRGKRSRSKKTKDQDAKKKVICGFANKNDKKQEWKKSHLSSGSKVRSLKTENGLVTVSQEELDLDMLKQFDLTWEYGPCIGITRLQRWERARLLGLDPPVKVKETVLKRKEDPIYLNSLWYEYPL